jgi:predicted Na+-dependent transporter
LPAQGAAHDGCALDSAEHLTLVFAVTSMLSVGFSYTFRKIIEPLRNLRGVLVALLANFVLVPVLTYALTRRCPAAASLA